MGLLDQVGDQVVTIATLVKYAADLHSEHGENTEYDRALYELVTDAIGLSMEERGKVADTIKNARRKPRDIMPRRWRKRLDEPHRITGDQYVYGVYWPATDLCVNDAGNRGTGIPLNVEWLDEPSDMMKRIMALNEEADKRDLAKSMKASGQ